MVILKAIARVGTGSHKAQALRAKNQIPGILYGHGQAPLNISLEKRELEKVIGHSDRLLEIEMDGSVQNVLIKEVEYDALGDDVLHIDLARVNLDERVEVVVPIHLRGTPVGATEGGVLQQIAAQVKIECTVRSIPEDIRVAVDAMKVGQKLTMKDLPLPEGAKLLEEPDTVVASVSIITEAAAAEGEEAVTAPEVIGEKKEEGEEAPEKK
jgi:large subunit ribosomal protein L25